MRGIRPIRLILLQFLFAPLLACGVLLFLAPPSAGSGNRSYRGTTSQGEQIFFTVYGHAVNDLWFRIVDTCAHGRTLRVTDHGVPAMAIKHHRFGGTFKAHRAVATLVVSGSFSGRTASGSLKDHTKNNVTHRFCTGHATFKLRPL